MIGLVAVGMERMGLGFKPSAPAPAPVTPPEPATLADELAVRGIREIPLTVVREYQRKYLREEQRAGRAGSAAVWTSYTPGHYKSTFGRNLQPIPPGVGEKIRKVEEIPNTRISIERFYADPFVFVTRSKDGRLEEACFAFWDAPGFRTE